MQKRIASTSLGALVALWATCFPFTAQAQFETRNEEGLKRNPAGVRVILRAKGARSTFHLYETIPIELDFFSSTPSAYSIELDETTNFAGSSNRFEVSGTDTVFLTGAPNANASAVCCASDKRYLTRDGLTLKRELTDYLRFEKPGTYSVFFITNRVFRRLGKQNDFGPSKFALTSNTLTLTILPDDPEWDSQQLATTLRKLSDPHVKANYLATVQRAKQHETETGQDFAITNSVSQTELVTTQKSLNALDTDEGILQRVEMMEMVSKKDLAMARDFLTGSMLFQPLLVSTTRADVLEAAMRARAEESDFGVDYDYVHWWRKYLVQRDHPELLRPFFNEAERQKNAADYSVNLDKAELELLAKLETLVQGKKGDAQQVTALTIKIIKSFRSPDRKP